MGGDVEMSNFPREKECRERYPSNFVRGLSAVNLQSYTDRLSDHRSELFCATSEETRIEIVDINPLCTPSASWYQLCTSEAFSHHIFDGPAPRSRVISLYSQNSLEPLGATEECLLGLLSHYDAGPEFLDLLFSFGGKPRSSDVGVGGMTVRQRSDGSYDMCYLMVYAEENRAKGKSSWPIRQTAVFHRFVPGEDGSLWIFVHPMPNSTLQKRLVRSVMDSAESRDYEALNHLHLLAISSYIDTGRWYLRSLSDEFEEIADIALTLDFSRPEDYAEGFKTLTRLQYLQDRILPMRARLETSAATIKELQATYALFQQMGFCGELSTRLIQSSLSSYSSKYRGDLAGVDLLKARVQGIIKLLSVALNLKNQATSVDINHNMLLLTKDTVDDSATVRVVTLVTLIYLPASFISSLLGTNLFVFESSEGSGFQISKQFWIFIALSVPLTLLTVGSWFYIAHSRRAKKVLQERERQLQSCGAEV